MPDLAMELEHLAQSNRHIAQGELIVDRQRALLERACLIRSDSAAEERVLQTLEDSLAAFNRHRVLILEAIETAQQPVSLSPLREAEKVALPPPPSSPVP
ncbi:hypothetical protein JNW90_07520 [Micromonospora sp. STR1s_5]|nr:hypothetical protein [Micromonospora sp. STR1s_5]